VLFGSGLATCIMMLTSAFISATIQ
jgi:hypothetical protein